MKATRSAMVVLLLVGVALVAAQSGELQPAQPAGAEPMEQSGAWHSAFSWLEDPKPSTICPFVASNVVPFSFVYDGKSSAQFLSSWRRTCKRSESRGQTEWMVQWRDPTTRLTVEAGIKEFRDASAIEWTLFFQNMGSKDTPILEQIHALDAQFSVKGTLTLDTIHGDDCSEKSFLPFSQPITTDQSVRLGARAGRSSDPCFPFFNLDATTQGLFVAVGWTGQWVATIDRSGDAVNLRAGMELTHLKLLPGERIRTPRILLMRWQGSSLDAHNAFRRLLLQHYVPKIHGEPMPLAIGAQCFNMNHRGIRPKWNTEAGQLAAARINQQLGGDTLWLDASWFDGGFPDGVGNWTVRRQEYPHGLQPIGEACNQLGIKFLVWWEPERVAPNTAIRRDHPEFVLGNETGRQSGLFNLGNPVARRWLTHLLLQQIKEFGVDTYRNDFNIDPLGFWRAADAPDRQGMTEIRYVEGLYQMWDEIRSKYPMATMDDCASGGRRIDLEMLSRAVIQTRSDTACTSGRSDWDQGQTMGLNLFLPMHSTIGWGLDTYDCRSSATIGFVGEWDLLDPKFPAEQARACIAEIKQNQQYWLGNYYPLTPVPAPSAKEPWLAFQLHREDLGAGIVLAFRRAESPSGVMRLALQEVDRAATYDVTFIDEQHDRKTARLAGDELATLNLVIDKPNQSLLVRYQAVK